MWILSKNRLNAKYQLLTLDYCIYFYVEQPLDVQHCFLCDSNWGSKNHLLDNNQFNSVISHLVVMLVPTTHYRLHLDTEQSRIYHDMKSSSLYSKFLHFFFRCAHTFNKKYILYSLSLSYLLTFFLPIVYDDQICSSHNTHSSAVKQACHLRGMK